MATVVAVLVGCCGASTARAADGDLFVDHCLAQTATIDCPAGLPANPIGVAISPDGNQLYAGVGTVGYTGLQIFDITATGPTPRRGASGCFVATNDGAACTRLPAFDGQAIAYDVAVAPDGDNVYVATLRGALLNFARSRDNGALAYVNCVGNGTGCTPLTAGQNVSSVAVSPDSRNVYARGENGLAVLDRTGSRTIVQKGGFAGCLNEGNPAGCTDVDGLAGEGFKVAVSPDGTQVYAISTAPGGITTFRRRPDGQLDYTQGACISSDRASGGSPGRCLEGGAALATAYVVAASPDGRFVYAGGVGGITSFTRAGDGLTGTGCYGPTGGCRGVVGGLSSVIDLVVTPDGRELIATTTTSTSIVSFIIGADGTLTPRAGRRGCITATGTGGECTTLSLVGNEWHRVAMDPNRLRFYVTSPQGMLATITRDFAPVCESITVETTVNSALSIPLRCADPNGDAFVLEKYHPPTAGQLGEIAGGTVFYNPFGSFVGSDEFTYRALTPSRQVPGPLASVKVNVLPSSANPSGLDNDRDGFTAGQDCNDSNAAIRPGAVEIKGNRLDENCDGFADPFPTLTSGIVNKWDVKGTRFTLTTLQVTQQFPKGWKARILCKGKGCPFKSKSLKAGKVKKGAATIISSLTKKQRRFRAGQTIEIWVSAPSFNTKVARLVLKKGKIPTTQPYCVLPDQTKVQKTCT